MGFDVDESGRHREARGIDDFLGMTGQGRAKRGDAAGMKSDVADDAWATAAIDNGAAMDWISEVMARARGALFADYWNGAAIRGGVLSGVSSQAIPMKSPVCEAELDQYRHPAFARQQTARQRQ